ncbi:hypothetical protein EDD27_2127 [Nonomuraea polychroma]|uniref:Uncharacterized protein n=2 Tax=Nonomuraea polychroma TaxID=46176 RepID=A0A438M1U2_9ACTN|nr:hypothetical protein EDD27_2127 [Nonomuraea polychroma]
MFFADEELVQEMEATGEPGREAVYEAVARWMAGNADKVAGRPTAAPLLFEGELGWSQETLPPTVAINRTDDNHP